MRRRILTVALSAVVLAVLLLGVPLAVAIQRNVVTEERGELERTALRAAVAVSPTYRQGDPVELPGAEAGVDVGVYTVSGDRVAGTGPARLEPVAAPAARGGVVDASTASDLIEAVPVSVDEKVIAVVRASSTRSAVRATVVRDVVLLAGLALVALAGAGLLAFWQARRLTSPMRTLAEAATELGAGDFSIRVPASGVPEIDATAEALSATAGRLSAQVARERAFATQASHQLRTPLTRLRLELEAGIEAGRDGGAAGLEAAVRDALATADQLSQTIDDVLVLAREPHGRASELDVERLLTDCVASWRGLFATAGRPLRLIIDAPPPASASEVAVRQVLQVLIDNAYEHGQGAVTVTARDSGGAVAIDVADRGTGELAWPAVEVPSGRLGLAMARDLAAAQHGRLLAASDASGTTFTLLVPAADDAG